MIVAAVLSVLAFGLAAREAHSQQLPNAEAQQQPAEEVIGPVAEEPARISPSKTAHEEAFPPETTSTKPLIEAPFAEIPDGKGSSVEGPSNGGALPPGSRLEPGLRDGFVTGQMERKVEPVLVIRPEPAIQVDPVPGQTDRSDLAPSLHPGASMLASGPTPELPDDVQPATRPDDPKQDAVPSPGGASERNTILAPDSALESEPDPESTPPTSDPTTDSATPWLVLEPIAFEENELVLPDTEEAPALVIPDVTGEETYVALSLQDSIGEVVGAAASAAASALESFAGGPLFQMAVEERDFVDVAFAGLFSIVEVEGVSSVSKPEEPESASAGSGGPVESPLRDTPQPVSPFAPPAGGNSFSLSGGGVIGPGGFALLLCILVFCTMLSRRDNKLLLTLRDLPKPGSALRLPLERPG